MSDFLIKLDAKGVFPIEPVVYFTVELDKLRNATPDTKIVDLDEFLFRSTAHLVAVLYERRMNQILHMAFRPDSLKQPLHATHRSSSETEDKLRGKEIQLSDQVPFDAVL